MSQSIKQGAAAFSGSHTTPMSNQITNPDYTQEQLQAQLRSSLAQVLYLTASEVDIDKSFVDLGLDSIIGVEWVKALNKQFNLEISATTVYDYSNIRDFASFLRQALKQVPVSSIAEQKTLVQRESADKEKQEDKQRNAWTPDNGCGADSLHLGAFPVLRKRTRPTQKIETPVVSKNIAESHADKIAIIGMSGRYPQASNLQQYWENLEQGKNSIVEIPKSRWNVDNYYDPDTTKKGKIYCKWLGMLDDADLFDPLLDSCPFGLGQ